MSIEFKCECGKTIRVKDDAAGRKVRCPSCEAVLRVPENDDDTAAAVTAAPPKKPPARSSEIEASERKPPKSKRRNEDDDDDDDDRPRSKRRRDEEDEADDEDDRPRKKRRRDVDDDDDDDARPPRRIKRTKSGSGGQSPGSAGATLGAGILMMIGAVVWFVAGLFADIIFFYPPILFVLGIVAACRGGYQLMNSDR